MQLFRLYLKILKKQYATVILYSCIFLTFFTLFAFYTQNSNSTQTFQAVKPNIAVLDQDHSELSKRMISFLKENATIVDIGESETEVKDALFYGFISYAIEIPKDFEKDFQSDVMPHVRTQMRPDNSEASMIEMQLNNYLNHMHTYQKTLEVSIPEIHNKVMQSIKGQLDIHMNVDEDMTKQVGFRNSYYNYYSYIVLAMIILVIGTTMIIIFRSDVHKRNLLSPISTSRMNLQLVFANIMVATIFWFLFTILVFILSPADMFTFTGLLYMLNSYIYTLICVAMAYLISCLLSNKKNASDALNGITNVIALSFSFLCGAFVPQQFISQGILNFSSFLPTYWYVKINDLMGVASQLTDAKYVEILQGMGIQVLFGIAFLLIALTIMKHRKSQEAFLPAAEQGHL